MSDSATNGPAPRRSADQPEILRNTVRTVRAVRRIGTSSHRRHASQRTAPHRKVAASLNRALHPLSSGQKLPSSVLIKICLLALVLVLPIYLAGLGTAYLLFYRKPTFTPIVQSADATEGFNKEFHVVNGRIVVTRKLSAEPPKD